jgi:hypothetical protein
MRAKPKAEPFAYTFGMLLCAAAASIVVSLALSCLVCAVFPLWLLTLPMRIWSGVRK